MGLNSSSLSGICGERGRGGKPVPQPSAEKAAEINQTTGGALEGLDEVFCSHTHVLRLTRRRLFLLQFQKILAAANAKAAQREARVQSEEGLKVRFTATTNWVAEDRNAMPAHK